MSGKTPTRQEALDLVHQYNETDSLVNHAKAVEAAMRYMARKAGADEEMCSPFSHTELLSAIAAVRNGKAAGPDGVHNEFFKHLGSNGCAALLAILNQSWQRCDVPAAWRRAEATFCRP